MAREKYTDEQVLAEANYLVEYGMSTYQMASLFEIPQSTAWWHMSVRLKKIDQSLHGLVQNELLGRWKGGGR